jgi:hypothetical protein
MAAPFRGTVEGKRRRRLDKLAVASHAIRTGYLSNKNMLLLPKCLSRQFVLRHTEMMKF